MQLYQGMDIGTAKLTPEERRGVPHHLLDVWEVTQTANVADYQRMARAVIDDLHAAGRVPVLVGGSGLYVRAALDELDFPGTDPKVRARLEAELAEQGPLALHARLAEANPRAKFIPNGANFERFVQAAEPQAAPADFPAGDGPVFVFVGALQSCIEYGFVAHAAKARPDWRFVFIGRKVAGVDLSALEALPNCIFLGLRPNEQLPAYLAQCDVCLNLFDNSDLSRDVSPLKFFEYLATGKPIVSTAQPEQVLQYAGDIHIADTPEEFLAACGQALSDTAPERVARRIELGRQCSWDSRVAQMERELHALDIL